MTTQEFREIEERAKKDTTRGFYSRARKDLLKLCKEVRILRGVIIKEAGYLPKTEQEAGK